MSRIGERSAAQRAAAPRIIAHNTLFMMGATVLARGASLVTTMCLTRYLEPAGYGDLTLAYAYWGLFVALVEAGLDLTLVREASQRPSDAGRLVGNSIVIRAMLAAAVYLLASVTLPAWGYGEVVNRLCRLALALLFLSPMAVWRTVLMINLEIKLAAILDLAGQLAISACVLGVLALHPTNVDALVVAQLGGTFFMMGLYWVYGRHLLPQPVSFRIDWPLCKRLLMRAWPIALAGVLYTCQIQVSRLIVGQALDSAQGGTYAVAVNLVTTLAIIPTLYFSTVYPLLSQSQAADPDHFHWLCRVSFRTMMSVILPVAVLVSLTAAEIIIFYAGPGYEAGVLLLVGLVWAEVFHFAGDVLYYIIVAANLQRIITWMSVILTVVRLAAFLLLLPAYGLVAAALALLIMHSVAMILYGILHATRGYVLDWLRSLVRPGVALLAVVVLVVAIRPPALLLWAGGLTVYALVLLGLQTSRSDRRAWMRWVAALPPPARER